MDPIAMRCHACQARIKAPAKLIGRRRPCPRCGQVLLIRIVPTDDADTPPIRDRSKEETAVIPTLAR